MLLIGELDWQFYFSNLIIVFLNGLFLLAAISQAGKMPLFTKLLLINGFTRLS